MENSSSHIHHEHTHHHSSGGGLKHAGTWRLAFSATLHCLLGCGLGEILGMSIGALLGWDNMSQMALAIVLGLVGGFVLGMQPLLKARFSFRNAFRQVLIAEGLSIVVMETAEVLTQVYTGVMHATFTDAIFWWGMLLSLVAGFIATFPINYYMLKKGVRHIH